MNAYFDYNIFVNLEESKFTFSDIEEQVKSKIDEVFYSPTHIDEAIEISGKNTEEKNSRLKQRFDTISFYTKNRLIYQDQTNKIFYEINEPKYIQERITSSFYAHEHLKNITRRFTKEQRVSVRESYGLKTEIVNNYSPEEVIRKLNEFLSKREDALTVDQLVENAAKAMKVNGEISLSGKIAVYFEFLDLFGYKTDKFHDLSNYARSADSSHTFYGSKFDFFITCDRRTSYKARAIYSHFDIPTTVILIK